MNFKKILIIAGIVALVLLTIGLLWLAITNGQRSAQSRQTVKDAVAITKALEYFYQDQDRYPSSDEFTDQNVMRQYLNNFPPQEFNSTVCPDSFDYVNTFRSDYELRFCLPKGVQGYQTGWNSIKAPQK